ncbi:DUF1214 domain-containing protein [Sinomonas humi]|uniref:DUF1214 domain-containing protein n=1 Tax=Sinomonas humi TaxID=1338436 RepID=A0A0B2APU2_9MICC|nr:DUF1214 domain-containing protein [Sinomonas humi]KHL05683.1 hypothetical protein LK10_00095 [Sinomonas humi]
MGGFFTWLAHSGVVQGVIIGATLAFLTAIFIMNSVAKRLTTTVNGWKAIPLCGRPGNGVLVRAACAKALPAVNVFEEAAYWTTTVDGSGQTLTGRNAYLMRVPPGQFPPNDAFWSLTVTDPVGYMVPNPIGRSSFDDRSDLVKNADGSVDIHLQTSAPIGREQNWLPIPAGKFKLMLRAYLPSEEILEGRYRVPEVTRLQ